MHLMALLKSLCDLQAGLMHGFPKFMPFYPKLAWSAKTDSNSQKRIGGAQLR